MNPTLQRLLDTKLIAVLRSESGEALVEVAETLLAGGAEAIEVTFNTAHAIEQVAVLGGGSVLDSGIALLAILAGDRFIVAPKLVSPNTNLSVIELGGRYSVPVMPGALTPTPARHGWQGGADFVEVFSADTIGPSYLQALRGPDTQLRLMPTGGVDRTTASDLLSTGACALGAGSSLVERDRIERRDTKSITERTQAFRRVVTPAQTG